MSAFFINAFACAAGIYVCGNVSPGITVGKDASFFSINLPRRAVPQPYGRMLRGFFHGNPVGVKYDLSDHSLYASFEMGAQFMAGDTFSGLFPIEWE